MEVYAAWSKESDIHMESNSGGLFYTIAKKIIEVGGYVCAAVYDVDFSVKHIISNNINDIKRMRYSKFCKSNLGNCFHEIKELLDKKIVVLFVGAPCQVKALNSFLKEEKELLITAQFPCIGLPSKRFWLEYVKFRTENENKKLKNIYCEIQQDSDIKKRYMVFEFEDDEKHSYLASKDVFVKYWNMGVSLSPCCYTCRDNILPVKSDIIWGNFWQLGEIDNFSIPYEHYAKGVSLLILNTSKGKKLFQFIQNEIYYYPRTLKEAITGHYMFMTMTSEHFIMKRYWSEQARNEYQLFCEENKVNKFFHDKQEILSFQKQNRIIKIVSPFIWRLSYYYHKTIGNLKN